MKRILSLALVLAMAFSMISTFASVLPLISVVVPRTSSWCAWCDVDRSNGDLRNLMVRMKRNPQNAGSM